MKVTNKGRVPLVVLLAVTLVGCATVLGKFGFREDDHRSEHALHKAKDVECIACHETIYDEEELGTVESLPKEAICLQCHKEQKAEGNCGMCHKRADDPGTYAKKDLGLKMNHAEHIERTEENCEVCHVALPQKERLVRSSTTMEACNSCHVHQEQFDSGKCDVCHTDLARYPLRPVTSYSHEGNYVKRHARDARASGQSCALCHEQTFCTDCHTAETLPAKPEVFMPERVERRFIHWGDYLTRHSTEARADAPLCATCHGQSFCTDCHAQQRLVPGEDAFNPHPPGFNSPGSPDFHGPAARRDINSCAACHDQGAQSNCVSCHKEGGIGGNPHPPSWLLKHNREEINHNAMCLSCHN